jgi:hypothetical protein
LTQLEWHLSVCKCALQSSDTSYTINLGTANYANSDTSSCKYLSFGIFRDYVKLAGSLDLNDVLSSLPTIALPMSLTQTNHVGRDLPIAETSCVETSRADRCYIVNNRGK